MPQALDEAQRKIAQLEIEREAIKREGNKYKIKEIDEDLANLRDTEKSLKAKWQAEKNEINKIQHWYGKMQETTGGPRRTAHDIKNRLVYNLEGYLSCLRDMDYISESEYGQLWCCLDSF